jgi:hypothetical protein
MLRFFAEQDLISRKPGSIFRPGHAAMNAPSLMQIKQAQSQQPIVVAFAGIAGAQNCRSAN